MARMAIAHRMVASANLSTAVPGEVSPVPPTDRRIRAFRGAVAVLSALAWLAGAAPAKEPAPAPSPLSGKPVVLDGDTLTFGGERYDIRGIDAPELDQVCLNDGNPWLCGMTAAFELKKILALSDVRCVRDAAPAMATVTCTSSGRDIAGMLLAAGAVVADEGENPHYRRVEQLARDARLGLWRGSFVPPAAWRRGARSAENGLQLHAACMIKGIVEGGNRLYLVPTDDSYATRMVSWRAGETIFCAIEDAEAHGWRRPPGADR